MTLSKIHRNAPSNIAFKRSFNSNLIGVPLFYLDGKRIGQIYHFRLRMKCSSLNHHLFSKKKTSWTVRFAFVVDQKLPNTTCLIVLVPQKMMQSISHLCEPTLNAPLYKVTDLSDETNRQGYILRTKRFQ